MASNHFMSQLRFSLTIDSANRVDPVSRTRLLVKRWSRTPLSKDALNPIMRHIQRSREKRKQEEEQGLAIEQERRMKETKRRKVEEDSLNLDQTKRELERIRSELKLLEDQKHSLVNQVKEFNHEETKIREIRRTLLEQHRTIAAQNLVPGIGSGIAVPRGSQPMPPQQVLAYGPRPPMSIPAGLPPTAMGQLPQLRPPIPPGAIPIGPPLPGLPPHSVYAPVVSGIKREPLGPPQIPVSIRSSSSATDVKPGFNIKGQFEAGLSPLSDSVAPFPHGRSHHMSPEGPGPGHRLLEHSPPQPHQPGPPYGLPGAGLPQNPLRSPLQPQHAMAPQPRGPPDRSSESLQGYSQHSRHATASPVEVNPHASSPRNPVSSQSSKSSSAWPSGPSRMRSPLEAPIKSEPERFGQSVIYPPADRTPPQMGLPMASSSRGQQPHPYGLASAASSSRGGRPPSPIGVRRSGERDEPQSSYREYGQPARREEHLSSSSGGYAQRPPQEYRESSAPRTHGSSPARNLPGGPPERYGGPPQGQGGSHHQHVHRSSVTSSPHHNRPPDSSRDREMDRFRPAEPGRRDHYEREFERDRERERSRESQGRREGESRERYSRERERERLYPQREQHDFREPEHERHGSGGLDKRGPREGERPRDPREAPSANPPAPTASSVSSTGRPPAVSPLMSQQTPQMAQLSALSVPSLFPMLPLVNPALVNPLIMGIPLVAAAAAAAGHNMPNIQQMMAQMQQQAPQQGTDPAQIAALLEQYQQQFAGFANFSAAANSQSYRRDENK